MKVDVICVIAYQPKNVIRDPTPAVVEHQRAPEQSLRKPSQTHEGMPLAPSLWTLCKGRLILLINKP